ncbi:hypothetical protein ACC771_19955, partial [Rhizobium ruizarguesonis]
NVEAEELLALTSGEFILVQRRFAGPGASQQNFGFRLFLPAIWRYRRAFGHVLIASLVIAGGEIDGVDQAITTFGGHAGEDCEGAVL